MQTLWARAALLGLLATSFACSSNVEPTESTTQDLFHLPNPAPFLTTIQKACGAAVTKG